MCEEGADFVSRGAQLPLAPAERELYTEAGSPILCGPLKEACVAPFSPRREGQCSAHGESYSLPRGMVHLRTSVGEPGSLVTWDSCFTGIHSSVTLDFSRHEGVMDPDMRITWPRGGRPWTAVERLLSRSRRATRGS